MYNNNKIAIAPQITVFAENDPQIFNFFLTCAPGQWERLALRKIHHTDFAYKKVRRDVGYVLVRV